MIHPFAAFNAANTPEGLADPAVAFENRRQAEFAAMLREAAGAATPRTAASADLPAKDSLRATGEATALRSTMASDLSEMIEGLNNLAPVNPDAGAPGSPAGELGPPSTRPSQLHFPDVPDALKFPIGPYRQAPPEHGGQWWQVSPFTGAEPWLNYAGNGQPDPVGGIEILPEGFVEIFGPRPTRAESSLLNHRVAVAEWEQALRHFQSAGLPEGVAEADAEAAADEFEAWGLGRPVFFEGRYGHVARFPGSQIPHFEATAVGAVLAPHVVIAQYQMRLLRDGRPPESLHPFLPPRLVQLPT